MLDMQGRALWAISPLFDRVFLLASLVLPFVFYGIYRSLAPWVEGHFALGPELFFFILFTGLFDAPHIFQTFIRTHGDSKEYRRRPWFHNLSLFFALLLTLGCYLFGAREIFISFLGFFGGWHIVRQNLGFLKVYQAKEAAADRKYHGQECLFIYTTWLYFLFHELNSRSEWLPKSWNQSTFIIGFDIATTCLWVFIFLYLLLRQCRRPTRLQEWPKSFFLYGQALSFFILAQLQTPFLIMIALATITHTWQYHGWINRYYKVRLIGRSWVHFAFYGTWLLGLGLILEGFGVISISWAPVGVLSLAALYNGFVLWHYFIDGFVWRFKSQPELKDLI